MSEIAPYTNDIARRMFIATADQNYMLARAAFFSELDLDFYWLSLHALEKYFKAILLLNGRSVKKHGHDLIKLHASVRTLHPDLSFGPFIDPHVDAVLWRNTTVDVFLSRLNEFGHASNRYHTYGFSLSIDDLLKVDQLMWSVRRHCRPLNYAVDAGQRTLRVDEVEALRRDQRRWFLSGNFPIESMLEGRRRVELRELFLRLNTAFAPDQPHDFWSGWRSASSNSPLSRELEYLASSHAAPETKATAAEVLRWALAHIKFIERDQIEITNALSVYEVNRYGT
jgi:hypothetical protein